MLKKIIGVCLIILGLFLGLSYKSIRWIPAPEGHPNIKNTEINFGKLLLAIILILGGVSFLFI
jgi:hypothetical protein